jgi:hypothetical protein
LHLPRKEGRVKAFLGRGRGKSKKEGLTGGERGVKIKEKTRKEAKGVAEKGSRIVGYGQERSLHRARE